MRWMLRARVCDPLGPRWIRAITPAVAATLIALPPFAPGGPTLRATAALLGVALFFGRRMLRLHFRARDATIRLHAGSIEIAGTGPLDQPVYAADVVAASTARTTKGVALALVRRGSAERPLVLDFADESDLEAVRRSLGLGHFGFGVVGWPTRVRSTALQGSTWLAFAWLTIAASSAFSLPLLAFTLALVVLPATVVALLVACLQDPRGPSVALTSAGIRFTDLPAWTPPVRYADVLDATVDPAGVVLATHGGPVFVPMGRSLPEEREHLAAQVLSAAARARGEGPPAPTLPAPLVRLAPRSESERDWLQRIDAAAASIAAADAYRGTDLDPKDLWLALENPDAPARVRAAAARVLSHVAPDEAKARVAHVLASDRDEHACACIRVALEEDVETAARELEDLEHAARARR
jgi:hypothetical protein